jgi:hypothetical protein
MKNKKNILRLIIRILILIVCLNKVNYKPDCYALIENLYEKVTNLVKKQLSAHTVMTKKFLMYF